MDQKRCTYLILTSLFLIILISSCLDRHFIDGKFEIVSISDTAINDSSIIEGYVQPVEDLSDYPYDPTHFEVWIDSSTDRVTTDSNGYYCLKTIPGIYTIRSQEISNYWKQLVVKVADVEILKNQKIRINFYIGYVEE